MNGVLRAFAPGKVNLALHLGELRDDGLHDLVSLVQAVSLGDALTLEPASADASADEVVCPGVEGENLAARALSAYREATGWDAPPVRLTIDKLVPVAAGMGGGSSDAAAALRLAAHAAGRPGDPAIAEIASALGSDVPALLSPGLALVAGAGERVTSVPQFEPFWLIVVPLAQRLATGDVFAEADRLGSGRTAADLAVAHATLGRAASGGGLPLELVHNDLEPAACSLCPEIEPVLADLRAAGAARALVSGSGPTAIGLFADWDEQIARESQGLHRRHPGSVAARPVGPEAGQVRSEAHDG
jgi:4-diphosphocytidyl-2-C-methyl-D-erythritol kinase